VRQLYPDSVATTAEQAAHGLRLADHAPADRPYLILNMISSVDGKAAVQGRTAPLANPADRALFHGLRTQVDAVMAGARTVGIERYGRIPRYGRGAGPRGSRPILSPWW